MALFIGNISPTNLASYQRPESFRRKIGSDWRSDDHFTVMRLSRPRSLETSASPTMSQGKVRPCLEFITAAIEACHPPPASCRAGGRRCCSRHLQIHAKEASQQIITNEAFLNCTSHARGINDRSFQPWQERIIPWLQACLFLGQ